jgi:hypothetical protein
MKRMITVSALVVLIAASTVAAQDLTCSPLAELSARSTARAACLHLMGASRSCLLLLPFANSVLRTPRAAPSCVGSCRCQLRDCLAAPVGFGECQSACSNAKGSALSACSATDLPCKQAAQVGYLQCDATCARDEATAFTQCSQAYLDCLTPCGGP